MTHNTELYERVRYFPYTREHSRINGGCMTISDQLRHYNKWRRGDETIEQPDPKELGELLDTAAYRLESLQSSVDSLVESNLYQAKLLQAQQKMLLDAGVECGSKAMIAGMRKKAIAKEGVK